MEKDHFFSFISNTLKLSNVLIRNGQIVYSSYGSLFMRGHKNSRSRFSTLPSASHIQILGHENLYIFYTNRITSKWKWFSAVLYTSFWQDSFYSFYLHLF